jgi:tetratricopeptide (TPR) repeat protein
MTHEEYLELGLVYVREGKWAEALKCLIHAEKGYMETKKGAPAALDSYMGLAIAIRGGKLEEAERRCRRALARACYQPDYYLNLGRVYLVGGKKMNAVQSFQLGLKLDDKHPGGKPVLEFLPRRHFLNKYLGKIQRRVKVLK